MSSNKFVRLRWWVGPTLGPKVFSVQNPKGNKFVSRNRHTVWVISGPTYDKFEFLRRRFHENEVVYAAFITICEASGQSWLNKNVELGFTLKTRPDPLGGNLRDSFTTLWHVSRKIDLKKPLLYSQKTIGTYLLTNYIFFFQYVLLWFF